LFVGFVHQMYFLPLCGAFGNDDPFSLYEVLNLRANRYPRSVDQVQITIALSWPEFVAVASTIGISLKQPWLGHPGSRSSIPGRGDCAKQDPEGATPSLETPETAGRRR